MEYIISILVAVAGGFGFLYYRKSKENTQLKADKDLTSQRERSKVVDEKVELAQKEVDELNKEMKEKLKRSDEFWKDYGKRK